jgi:ASC-1-like (ASCH) protein
MVDGVARATVVKESLDLLKKGNKYIEGLLNETKNKN